MDWGMKNRMSRIIKPETGRAVMLALDHGYFLGPTHRLEEPRKTIEPLLPYADTIMLTRGVLRSSVDPEAATNVVLRVSGGTSIVGPDLTDEGLTTSFEEAIRLNVAGVGISVFRRQRARAPDALKPLRASKPGRKIRHPCSRYHCCRERA